MIFEWFPCNCKWNTSTIIYLRTEETLTVRLVAYRTSATVVTDDICRFSSTTCLRIRRYTSYFTWLIKSWYKMRRDRVTNTTHFHIYCIKMPLTPSRRKPSETNSLHLAGLVKRRMSNQDKEVSPAKPNTH